MKVRAGMAWIVLAVLALAPAARADDALLRARAHFETGRGMYELGNYSGAIREFSAGWDLVHKPEFVLNIGQCYRQLGQLAEARAMYRKFLAVARPDDPARPGVERVLAEIDRKLAAAPPPATAPPPSETPRAAARVGAAPATATLTATAPAPAHRSGVRHLAWILPVSAVVVGVALGVGIYYGTHTDWCGASALGCLDASH